MNIQKLLASAYAFGLSAGSAMADCGEVTITRTAVSCYPQRGKNRKFMFQT